MAENEDVTLLGCAAPNGVIEIPADYTGKLILQNCTLASIRVAEATTFATRGAEAEVTNIEILGNVKIVATEDGMSAITGKNLNITGNGHLTAIGMGNHAYGIGGDDTASICIEGITIDSVVGGHAGAFGEDTKYYKDAPEGGAAIGSGLDGAVITLNKVTIKEAIGGSKAAGIGARYHTGVTVNITDSTIAGVEGGVSAAGIGGSCVSSGADESGTTINITNSTITAKGGAYGAGIGSGYDTHCQSKQPLCTINIMSSTINATGGLYAAGVGTGYHHAALTGEIKDSKVTALSGDKYYKSEYTIAMDVGFGVVDPVREGQQTDSSLIYQGQELVIPGTMTVVANAQELAEAVTGGETMLYLLDGVYDIYACHGKTLELYGGKGAVINIVGLGRSEAGGQLDYGLDSATVTFNGLTIRTNGETYAGFSNLKAVYNNCTFESTYCVTGDSEFNNCTINMDGDWYTVWTADGTGKVKIVIDGVEVN
jgi:hypothetical protein